MSTVRGAAKRLDAATTGSPQPVVGFGRFLERLLPARQATGTRRVLAFVYGLALIVALGVLDFVTGGGLSLDALCFVPVIGVTSAVSARAGLWLALLASSTWVVVDNASSPHSDLLSTGCDFVLRFVVLAIVGLLVASLQEALAEARGAEHRTRRFLDYASHQLRTPVTGIRSSAEALILAGAPPEKERLLTNVVTEAERIGRIVDSMLHLARIDEGYPIDASPVEIGAVCRHEVGRAQERATSVGVQVKLHADAHTSRAVVSSVAQEALANVLDNALRHARCSVSVTVTAYRQIVQVIVRDDGEGLPPGTELQAFERFVTIDGHGGAGLGLAIGRSLCESQGGTLVYRDSAFVIELPAV